MQRPSGTAPTTGERSRTPRAARIDEETARIARAGNGRRSGFDPASDAIEGHFLAQVESQLGWKLDAGQRALALQRCEAGDGAPAVAEWLHRLESARTELNDPTGRAREHMPSRPEQNDPRRFESPRARRYKP